MEKVPHTTVNLTDVAQEVKEDLAPIFGLKNILSAGLLLFSRLSDSNQKKIVAEANSLAYKAAVEDENAAALVAKGQKRKSRQPSSRLARSRKEA